MIRSRLFWAAGLALALSLGSAARADVCNYDLGIGNSGISGYPAPYGSVAVDLTSSTTADFTFTAASNASYNYLFGGQGTVGANINADTFTVTNIDGNITDPTQQPAGNLDGWGSFNLVLDTFDGFTHANTTVTFTVNNTSGTWASCADVLTGNDNDHLLAAHVFVANSNGTNTGATGFATNGGGPFPPGVPEPSSMAIAGLGLLGFLGFGLRRRMK